MAWKIKVAESGKYFKCVHTFIFHHCNTFWYFSTLWMKQRKRYIFLLECYLTCNLADFFDKRWHQWHRWLQLEEEAGWQRLVRHLVQWQERRMTAGFKNTSRCWYSMWDVRGPASHSVTLQSTTLPLGIQLHRLHEHRWHLKLVSHGADANSHLSCLDSWRLNKIFR